MEQQRKNAEELVSTHFHSVVYFAKEVANCKRCGMQLFERGLLVAMHRRTEEGPFEKKAEKTHFISNNDFEDLALMLRQARIKMNTKSPFEFAIAGKESAFGIFGVEDTEGNYICGLSIYDVVEGQIIQKSKLVCPFSNSIKLKSFASDGTIEDMVRSGATTETETILNKINAILAGTSTIESFHQSKLAKKFANGNANKKVEVNEEYIPDNKAEDDYWSNIDQ